MKIVYSAGYYTVFLLLVSLPLCGMLSPLHRAAKENREQELQWLIAHCKDIDAESEEHMTSLHYASISGHEQAVRLLLEAGADINKVGLHKNTPLHLAVLYGHKVVCALLLERRAARFMVNDYNKKPIDIALDNLDHDIYVQLSINEDHLQESAKSLAFSFSPENDGWLESSHCIALASPSNKALLVSKKGTLLVFPITKEAAAKKRIKNNVSAVAPQELPAATQDAAQIKALGGNQPFALHRAAFEGDIKKVEQLIAAGYDLERQDNQGRTPLFEAARKGSLPVVKVLLEKGAVPHTCTTDSKWTPLMIACWEGHLPVVSLLAQYKYCIDLVDIKGCTALHSASFQGHTDIVRILIQYGANTLLINTEGVSARNLAKKNEIKALLAGAVHTDQPLSYTGINRQGNKERTRLHEAAAEESIRKVKELLEKGADMRVIDERGNTPLARAVWKGRKDIAELLLEKGAVVDAKNNYGETPLHLACIKGLKEIAEMLISYGASVTSVTKKGNTPLHLAARYGSPEYQKNCGKKSPIVELLIKKGAEIKVVNIQNRTPLHEAVRYCDKEVVKILLDAHAPVNVQDDKGRTALHLAVDLEKNAKEIVEMLLSYNAVINLCDAQEVTPLHIAAKRGAVDVVELLLSKGADPTLLDSEKKAALHVAKNSKTKKLLKNIKETGIL